MVNRRRREPPLYIRRQKLSIQYCLKLSTSTHYRAYNSVFNYKFKRSFDLKPNQIPPLGIRLQPELQAVEFKKRKFCTAQSHLNHHGLKEVLHCSVPSKPPWLLKRPQTDFSMHDSCKESTHPEIFRAKYYEICDQYKDYCKLYTDGSMSGVQTGSATICGNTTKLLDFLTVLVFSQQSYMPSLWHLIVFTAERKITMYSL